MQNSVNKIVVHGLQLALLFLAMTVSVCFPYELSTLYATISYEQEDQLLKFNRKVSIPGPLYTKEGVKITSAGDEVKYKIDSAIDRIQILLHVCPRNLNFNIRLLTGADEVQAYYKSMYGEGPEYISFYSPKNRLLLISVNDVSKRVLVHELTHVVTDQYFMTSPSVTIQEILAHYVETHIGF